MLLIMLSSPYIFPAVQDVLFILKSKFHQHSCAGPVPSLDPFLMQIDPVLFFILSLAGIPSPEVSKQKSLQVFPPMVHKNQVGGAVVM
jgi:hypothetical protein